MCSVHDITHDASSSGGMEHWVNRKMLVLDPRGELVEFNGEPLLDLPTIEEEDGMNGNESDDDSPEWSWAITALPDSLGTDSKSPPNGSPPILKPNVCVGTKKQSGDLHVIHEPQTLSTTYPLRRSERLKKRLSCWPNAIT